MGNQQAQTQAIKNFIDGSEKVTRLNRTESALVETNLVKSSDEGPVVIKRLFHIASDDAFRDCNDFMTRINSLFDTENKHPNVLTYHKESPARLDQGQKEKDKNVTVALRQFVCFNLLERQDQSPLILQPIEKQWLIFQILCGLDQIHSEGMVHGDIKPDNILVTSYDWVMITDMASKPALLMDDDLKKYNLYFGHLDNNLRAYVAPERWYSPGQTASEQESIAKIIREGTLKPSMDIFSAGCVIAEIMMDGTPLFDLAQLAAYKKGQFDPKDVLQKYIEDDGIVKLICSMIDPDAAKRPTSSACLTEWNAEVFPKTFSRTLFQIGASFLRVPSLYSDNRVSLIRYHINSIFENCFDVVDAVKTMKIREPIDPEVFRLIQQDDTIERARFLVPQFKFFQPSRDTFDAQYKQDVEETPNKKQKAKETALILIQMLGSFYTSCFLPQSKLVALEMIQKLSEFLTFDIKLGYVLPIVMRSFDTSSSSKQDKNLAGRSGHNDSSKCRVKALEVMLSLFQELHECTEEVIIEAFDYKVFQNYILPVIKRLMEQSKTDSMLKLSVARNLSLIARVGTRMLEVTIGSCNKRREEQQSLKHAEAHRFEDEEHKKDFEEKFMTMTRLAKTTIKRGTLAGRGAADLNGGHNQSETYEEELVSPNYDAEMQSLWQEIQAFIQSFSGEKHDSSSIESMLKNLSDLSLLFGVERSDFLIQQCISAINRKDYRVRIQVLKTLTSLSLRVGQKKVSEYVLPLTESLLEDPEDMVILENIKMLNVLIKLRLVTQKQTLEILEKLSPFLYHPNRQLRINVVRFITIIATVGHHSQVEKAQMAEGHKFVVDKRPLFSREEFFCFVRPKVLPFLIDSSDPLKITSEKELMGKLKPHLSLAVMQKYFKILRNLPQSTSEQRKYFQIQTEQLPNQLCDKNDNDTTAFAFLSEIFKEKLKQMKLKGDQSDPVENNFYLQNSIGRSAKVYRVIQTNALAKLMGVEIPLGGNNRVSSLLQQAGDEDSSHIVKDYLQLKNKFDPQRPIRELQQTNFGQNNEPPSEIKSALPVYIDNLMKALHIVPTSPLTKPYYQVLRQTKSKIDGVSECINVGHVMVLPKQSAQVSLTQHFDAAERNQNQHVRVHDQHRKDYQLVKNDKVKNFSPQGTLITTLYEHKNPVNTVTVSEDNRFFLTGSREDKSVHIWSVANIEKDVTSRSVHSFATPSSYINQIQTIQNSHHVAVAGSSGLRVIDLGRSMQEAPSTFEQTFYKEKQSRKNAENLANLVYKVDLEDPQDEVTQCVNMILPNDSGQHLIAYTTARGGLHMNDLRAKSEALRQDNLFGCQRGLVTSLVLGQDAYTLVAGTLGGYVMVYDVRYSAVSSVFRHSMNYPTMALATIKKTGARPSVLVSAGGASHEVSQLNLETGHIDTLLRSADASSNHPINKMDIPVVPQYVRETGFRDNMMSTLKRESNFQMFNRGLLSVKNHDQFVRLMNQTQRGLINNIDQQLWEESKFRYMLARDAYESPCACRTILVPRYTRQSLMFDGQTGHFAITGGNDKKLRYWNLQAPSTKSYSINTPRDEEVTYLAGNVMKGAEEETKIIQEKTLAQKEYPMMTAQRIKDNVQPSVSGQGQLCIINGQNVWVKYKENSVYHNTIQSVVAEQDSANLTKFVDKSLQRSSDQGTNSQQSMVVTNFNGTSQGQHFNDLGLYANAAADSVPGQERYRQSSELATEKIIRNSESVSHSDTILDLATVEFNMNKSGDWDGCKQLLISCSRDTTVKIWR